MSNKPVVRWWVVIGAIVVGWALACFGPRAAEAQVVADSITLRRLVEFRTTDDYDNMLCLAVRRDSMGLLIIDSIIALSPSPPCPTGTNGLGGNAPPGMPEDAIERVSLMILADYPEFIIACAIRGIREEAFSDGATLFIPMMWCTVR